ncbi:MAG: hypothetical protein ACOZNI_12765 [Myxococcota bacterium]
MILPFAVALAEGEEEERDEDAIFGEPAAPPEAVEGEPFLDGERATTDADILSRLGVHDDDVVVGGQLYLRLDGAFTEDTPALEDDLSSPSLLDLFVDARPNDRVRAFVQGRLTHDVTVPAGGETDAFGNTTLPTEVLLDQLWVKGDLWRKVYLTAGKQRIKWGTGRFWNPTDFLNAPKDPLAVFDERTGVALVKAHVPFEALGGNVYLVADLQEAGSPRDVGGAARAEWLFGQTEVAASAHLQDAQPVRLGADVSSGIGPLDVHVEGAVRHGDRAPYYRGELDFETFTFPDEYKRKDDWIPQVVGGAEVGLRLNDEDSLYLGAEYYWNDAGYDDVDLYPWIFVEGAYVPFQLGRQYAAAYVYLPSPGQWDDASFTASWIGNLSDGSNVARLDVSGLVLTNLRVNAYGAYNFGEVGELRYSLEVEALDIAIPAPIATVGVGARLEF